ncbi:AMP deaminase 2 [Chionoecetes opilio]|uniref:AMP deaminase 2 n=1 Tax=Chionoecetes opilio TaxID=41210 RepID=A0A8J4XUK2_CHIOP|nr:AMP deaminase 2 [Chionoecetes opilio]
MSLRSTANASVPTDIADSGRLYAMYPRQGSESPVFGGFRVDPALKTIEAMMESEGLPQPNKISAPYEVPQFPIEQIEDKLKLHRHLSAIVERQTRYEPSETAADENDTKPFDLDETDYVPHYQRVFISGEETASVPVEDISKSSKLLVEALRLREKYMTWGMQNFPAMTSRFLREAGLEQPMGQTQRYAGACSDPKSLEVPLSLALLPCSPPQPVTLTLQSSSACHSYPAVLLSLSLLPCSPPQPSTLTLQSSSA